jgi:hypothetical protein
MADKKKSKCIGNPHSQDHETDDLGFCMYCGEKIED